MFRHVLFSLALIFLTVSFATAKVELALDDYEHWQAYNGWPIQVIEFPGIHSFSRTELLNVMATEQPSSLRRYVRVGGRTTFYADDFAADLFRISHFYRHEGFRRAKVRGYVTPHGKRRELRLKFEITEGTPLLLKTWNLIREDRNAAALDSARWWPYMPIRIGKRLPRSALRVAADTLAYKLQEIGYARAHADYSLTVDSVRNEAQVTFTIYAGPLCRMGTTHITGLKQVNESTARRELAYQRGDIYSPLKLEETRRNLVRLETFTFVNVKADTTTSGDTLEVWINTEEGWRYRVRFGGGYDTEDAARATVEFTDLNFFGAAKRFTLSGSVSKFQRQAQVRFFWPHVPWRAIDLTLLPTWELQLEKAFHTESQTATTIFSGTPLRRVTASLSNEIGASRTNFKLENRDSLAPTLFNSIESLSMSWDTRNNPLVPTAGHVIRFTCAESGAFYRTDQRWWKMLVSARELYPATHFITLAGKAEFGIMGPLHGQTETPIDKRFFLGGPTAMRGWARQQLSPRDPNQIHTPIGGDLQFNASAEVRQNIFGPFSMAVFADAGNVWFKRDLFKPLDLFTTAGVGAMLLTPVGPVRLDFGYQVRRNPYGEQPWAFHFSLGTPF
jgi:outer membrane protein assembly complex protein YaeT